MIHKKEKAPCYSHGAFIYVGDDPSAALRAGSTLPHTFACSMVGPLRLKSARSIPQTAFVADRGNRRSLGFARDDNHWERVTTSRDRFRSWVERGRACNETAYPPTMRYLTFLALKADNSSLNSSNIPFGLFHPTESESKFRDRAQALMRRQ